MSAININKSNFQNEVMNSDKPVLLDFWAPWCVPCRMVVPIVEEIARERSDIKVGKINVDENPELAGQFGVMSIPITQLHQFVKNRIVIRTAKVEDAAQLLKIYAPYVEKTAMRYSVS